MSKLTKKLLMLVGLVLVLGLASMAITDVIIERTALRDKTVSQIAESRGAPQHLQGPLLVVPYTTGEGSAKQWYFFSPESTSLTVTTDTHSRKRAIYEALLYKATVNLTSTYQALALSSVVEGKVTRLTGEAVLLLSLSSPKGLSGFPRVSFDQGPAKEANPQYTLGEAQWIGISVPEQAFASLDTGVSLSGFTVQIDVSFKGSHALSFLPYGHTANVTTSGNWSSPSFVGVLPDTKMVGRKGFQAVRSGTSLMFATPKSGAFSEEFRTKWAATAGYSERGSTARDMVGIRFVQPYDAYLQNHRAIKYALMFIVMTFAVFFVIEVLKKLRIHPVQYSMVGAALVLFYLLLLSLSEIIGFSIAYLLATCVTIGLISAYTLVITGHKKTTGIVAGVLLLLYLYLYTLLQQEEYALLIGSIGLVAALGGIMYATRQVNRYGLEERL